MENNLLKGHTIQTERAMKLWQRWYDEIQNTGITPTELAKRYTNPNTGKPYSVKGVYKGLKRLKELKG